MAFRILWLLLLVPSQRFALSELPKHTNLDFGSSCPDTYHMLIYSLPLSCNEALEEVLAVLPALPSLPSLGDLCQVYCITPLRQAAVDCSAIADVLEVVMGACCHSTSGERCFDHLHKEPYAEVVQSCSENCSEQCSSALGTLRSTMGCCFSTLFNTTLLNASYFFPFASPDFWDGCEQLLPPPCPWCSYGTTLPYLPWTTLTLLGLLVPTYVLT